MKTFQITAITFFTLLTLLFSPSLIHAQDWYPEEQRDFRKEITINAGKVPVALENFPLLVKTNDSHLLTNADATGIDILFTADNGTELLDYEIESYDPIAGLVAWVKIPTLNDTTVIYMYYGNPSAGDQTNPPGVWDDNYVMVHHLNETTGDHLDSTSFLNHGTPIIDPIGAQGSPNGKIDGADEFDGNDYVACGDDDSLDTTGSMTIEAWAYSENGTSITDNSKRIACKDPVGSKGKFIFWKNGDGNLAFQVTDNDTTWSEAIGSSVPDDEWMYVVGVFDAAAQKVRLYTNGNQEIIEVDGPSTLKQTDDSFTIGAPSTIDDQFWKGIIDEVRVSNTARSADWILTSYNNQNDPGSFYLIGDVEPQCTDNNDCGFCEKCDAGICVLQVNEDLKGDCSLCEKCNAGFCEYQSDTEDVKGECPDGECLTGLCDGTGDCGFDTLGASCDDGAYCTDGDTCDGAGTCQPGTGDPCQAGEVCNEATDTCDLLAVCGNGTPEGTEDCDDGNTDDGDCCSATCTFEAAGSTCDDGAYCTDGDTCDGAGTCQPGAGDPCTPPDVCNESTDSCDSVPVCGNGTPEGTEDCDDGNTDDGDCCSATCTFEAAGSTCDDGAYCTDGDTCDGAGTCQPGAGDPCTPPEVCDEVSDQCLATVPGQWWNTAWPYRKELTIDSTQVEEDLTGFPVLIDITDADLAVSAQANGEDIVFTDINGSSLSHEIELYDGASRHLIAWVNVPSLLSTEDTTLYMYFGNGDVTSSQEDPAGTWASNGHVMVQHLDETTGTHIDSTGKGNDGTAENMGPQQDAQGKIDGADQFDGTDNLVRVPDSPTLDITGSMTVEAWAYSDGGTGSSRILAKDKTGQAGKFILWRNNAGDLAFIVTDGIGNPPNPTDPWYRAIGSSVTDGEWFQVVGVFDAGAEEVRLYKDGTEVAVVAGPSFLQSNTETVTVGASDDSDHIWNGTIDEVRISDVARSSGWIQTSYTNQNDPGSFTAIEDVETQCEGNFDCDEDCDGSDARLFKLDFGRPFDEQQGLRPCTNGDPCNGDFNCDGDVDGTDAQVFKQDFGRSIYRRPCSPCAVYDNCAY
jgi:cysteine-rich repeat protein